MKTIIFCILTLLAIPATAQLTDNQRNGAFAYGGVYAPELPASNRKPEWRKVGTNLVDANYFKSFECRAETKAGNVAIATIQDFQGWRRVAIRNYAGEITSGKKLYIRATRDGVYQDGAEPLELWDCGTAPSKTDLQEKAKSDYLDYQRREAEKNKAIENAKKAAAAKKQAADLVALKANQDAATKGDMFGLLRMGERYRDGDGVEKDLVKAKEYLQKAADAGSPTAKDELSKLEAK